MHSCDSCGVWEIFADLKRIPPVFLVTFPMDNRSRPEQWICVDERGCVRRSRMRMQPGAGLLWGHEMTGHVLIGCKSCGQDRTAQGVREKWVEGDPFPEHTFICSCCGAEYARSKWTELAEKVKQ